MSTNVKKTTVASWSLIFDTMRNVKIQCQKQIAGIRLSSYNVFSMRYHHIYHAKLPQDSTAVANHTHVCGVPITVAAVIGTPANNCVCGIFWIQLLAQLKKSTNVLHRNMNDGHNVAKFVLYLVNVEMQRSDVKHGSY